MTGLVTLSRKPDDEIAVITFENPPRGYLNRAQVAELAHLLDGLENDPTVRVIVFTGGVPNVFIRHYDVAEILEAAAAIERSGADAEHLRSAGRRGNPISQLFDRIDRLPKPTIAAINGFCQGGGFEFALCCDIRIAQPGDYRIGLPETNIGIFPGAGGTQRLPRVVGEAKALELILRGRTLTPTEAAEAGLVHELAQQGALTRSIEIAREQAARSPRGVADAKALVKGAVTRPLTDGQAEERFRFSLLLKEDEQAIEAMKQFLATGEDINRG